MNTARAVSRCPDASEPVPISPVSATQRLADTGRLHIGVVIPCRGDHALLEPCLESLREFTRAGDQIVVVDGDADPRTGRIAQLKGTACLHSPDSQRGAAIARGVTWLLRHHAIDVLLVCHTDMILQPGTRPKLLQKLANQAPGQWGLLGHRIDDSRFKFRLLEWGNRLRAVLLHVPYGDQAMFVGVALLARAGGWPCQPVMEDLELSLRLRNLRAAIFIDAPVTISARHWAGGVCRATIRNWSLAAGYVLTRRKSPCSGGIGNDR